MTVFFIGLESGLAQAGVYLLIAISFTLILSVSGVFSFVQGSLIMLATIFTFELTTTHNWPALLVLLILLVGGMFAGVLTDLLLVRPAVARSRHSIETTLLTTLGGATAINALAALLFGSGSSAVPPYVSPAPWRLGQIPIDKTDVLIVCVTVVITLAFDLVLRKTASGRMTRVTLEDPEGARLLGINVRRVIVWSFAIAGALAMLAGWLVAPVISASASNAQQLAFFAFAAMAIGGFGSFSGAMIGAVIVGLVNGLAPVYLSSSWATPLILFLVGAVLVVRPTGIRGVAGLFGAQRAREI